MVIDWESLLLGLCFGVPVSVLFFAGLAWGMQLALRSIRPAAVLLLSSVCRISMLLAAGFWITAALGTGWSVVGFVLAFFLIRLLATLWAQSMPASTAPHKEVT